MATKVDMSDPNVKRLAYNMYRGMLGGYNHQANGIINTMPRTAVTEDQGIHRQIESMMRQSSQLSGGGSPSPGISADGGPVNVAPSFAAPPPPPPPVPGVLGLPTTRINTEIADTRGRGKEPPAAVLNAMMSKDKKPFTYTPGGIDLSQIKSPRMQRRIERNAAAEGVAEQPAKPASSLSPSSASPMTHPQIAVPVFPPTPPPPPPPGMMMNNGNSNRGGGMSPGPPPPPTQQYGGSVIGGMAGHPQLVIPKNPVLRPTGLRHDKSEQEAYAQQQQAQQRESPNVYVQQRQPANEGPQPTMYTQRPANDGPQPTMYSQRSANDGPQPTMYSQRPANEVPQPTMYTQRPANDGQQGSMYMQRPQNSAQYDNPPTKRPSPPKEASAPSIISRAQLGSLYIPPVSAESPVATAATPGTSSPIQLNKAPTPWMSQQKPTPQVPAWAAKDEGVRIIPMQIEGREPPQQQQQQQQQQQRQIQQQQQQREQQQSPGTRIIPIQIESAAPPQQQQQQQQQPHRQQRTVQPVYQHNKFNPPTPSAQPGQQVYQQQQDNSAADPRQLQQQQSWSGVPVQSRAFKVLQKITDTDQGEEEGDGQEYPSAQGNQWGQQQGGPQEHQYQQTQHQQQPHPKQQQQQQWGQHPQQGGPQDYSGPQWGPQNTQGVPVSQLRKLQLNEDDRALMNKFKAQVSENNLTNEEENPRYRGGHIPSRVFQMLDKSVPRGPTPGAQHRPQQSQADAPAGPYIPASQQQVQEPRKYTGGAIPSRSFRMLQAMTAPENCGPDQSDM